MTKALLLLSLAILSAQAQPLILGVPEQHENLQSSSKRYSLAWQVFHEATKHADLEIQLIPLPWPVLMSHFKANKVDAIFGATKTADRLKWARFSSMLATSELYLYSKPELLNSSIDLNHASIAVVKDSAHQLTAQKLGFVNIYSARDLPTVYQMVMKHRLDYMVAPKDAELFGCQDDEQKEMCLVPKKLLASNNIYVMYKPLAARIYSKSIEESLTKLAESNKIKDIYQSIKLNSSEYERWLMHYQQNL